MIYVLTTIFIIYFFSILWIIVGFYKKRNFDKISPNFPEQKISVIIPVRNEVDNIKSCLESLFKQNFSRSNFEIIVVNDHSTDNTIEVVENLKSETEIPLSIIHLTDKISKKEALSEGVKNAQHIIIATTDADCVLPEDWLFIISNQFTSNHSMLLGPIMFSKLKGLLNAFQILDFSAIQGLTFASSYFNNPILNNAANLAFLKKSFKSVNGYDNYDTPSGDDVFLLEKFSLKNLPIKGVLNNDFIVETEAENSWFSFFNQRIRWASKTSFYKSKLLLFFSFLIFLINISILFVYFNLIFVEGFMLLGIIFLLSKWLIDFILLFLVTSFYKKRATLLYFIPVQILYPIYVFTIGVASKVYRFEWKGRRFNEK